MPTANNPIHFKWQPIEDFEGDPKGLTDGELRALREFGIVRRLLY